MRRISLAFLLSLCVATAVSAATFDRVNDSDLLIRADLVVVATVVDEVAREAPDRMIYTDYRLLVDDTLKGSSDALITVSEAGGFLGGRGVVIPGAARYTPGTRVVTFLRKRADGTWQTAFMGLGSYRFDRVSGRDLLVRDAGDVVLLEGEPGDVRDAEAFLAAIRSGAPERAPRLPQVQSSSVSELTPVPNVVVGGDYALKGGPTSGPILPFRWECPSIACPGNTKSWTMGNQIQSGNDETLGVQKAQDAWSDEPFAFINLNVSGTNTLIASNLDSSNDIVFSSTDSSEFCEGTIGCGVLNISTDQHEYPDLSGQMWYTILGADVVVRPGPFAQGFFELILTHEFGHGIGIRHSNQGTPSSSSAVMNSTITGSLTTLKTWDREAVSTIYGTGLPCTNVAITSHTPNATVPYNTQVTLSVGLNAATTPVTYQWYKGTTGDTSTQVATTTTYKPVITETAGQSYWVRVSNCNGAGTADSMTMTQTAEPCIPVEITTQPSSQRVEPNQKVTLSVSATGSPDLTYKWYEGVAPDTSVQAPGTNTKKTYTSPTLTAPKSYWVRVKNDCGEKDSATASIAVGNQCVPATATAVATALTTSITGSATMAVVATGDAPYTYQWYQGTSGDETTPIVGAIADTHTAGPFTTPGTFSFWVKVENSCGKANSATIVVTVECNANLAKPQIFAPASSPRAVSYLVTWTGDPVLSPTSVLEESTSDDFSTLLRTFPVTGFEQTIPAHTEVTVNTRFYYRVRSVSICTQQFGDYSRTQSTLILVPQPKTSRQFNTVLPFGTDEPFKQELFVTGFGETALAGDTYAVSSDASWMIITPASGPLPAAGITVEMTASPGPLDVGTSIATITVVRTQGPGKFGSNTGSSTTSVPFSMNLVTPVTPDPRSSGAPPGTLVIPAVAHADGFNTRFQSDVRIANISGQEIEYEMTYTPSGQDGSVAGSKTTIVIPSNESRSFDDIVNNSYASGVGGNTDFAGTLEIRPLNAPDAFSTIASSRTYAITSNELGEAVGTLGQFIPALNIDDFVGDVSLDSLASISLQQIANSASYRTNVGLVEGTGQSVTALVKLLDANNNVIAQTTKDLPPFGHYQGGLSSLMGTLPPLEDGRIEVETLSAGGKVTAYASVLDNATNDPLLVFPTQAGRISANNFVLPGVADGNFGSNFHSDMRIFNGGNDPVTLTVGFEPLNLFTDPPRPADTQITLQAGEVMAIDDTLPTLWGITQTAGAVQITSSSNVSVVATARTYSNVDSGGTNGQFIPAMTSSDAVGLGERSLTVLQLEQSPQFRTNFGLVEVTGAAGPTMIEITAFKPDSKLSAVVHMELDGNEYTQLNSVFASFFGADTNIYGGRISVKVVQGEGRVAAYGSVVDSRTSDPTYVPAQ